MDCLKEKDQCRDRQGPVHGTPKLCAAVQPASLTEPLPTRVLSHCALQQPSSVVQGSQQTSRPLGDQHRVSLQETKSLASLE